MNCDGGDNTVCAVRREKHEAAVCGIDEEADGGASREVRKMVSPQMPSQQEVEAHELTHLPFRNWCRHCMRGRGKEMPHKKSPVERASELKEFSLD